MTDTLSLDDQIAALLRDGLTQAQVVEQLNVGTKRVCRVRTERNIPVPPERAKRTRAEVAAAEAEVVTMLRAGATVAQIRAKTRVTAKRIAALRSQYEIPIPPSHRGGSRGGARQTVEEAYARHAHPVPDGHVIWTGPRAGRSPTLLAGGRNYNPRVIAFREHHGREPEGCMRRTCTDDSCIAGAHLTDKLIRTETRRMPR